MKRWIAVVVVIVVIAVVVVVCSNITNPSTRLPHLKGRLKTDSGEVIKLRKVSFEEGDDVVLAGGPREFMIEFERIADKETAVNVSKVLADSYGKQLGLKKLELSFTEYDADDKVWTVTFAEESGGGVLNIAIDQVNGGVVKVWQDDDAAVTDAVAIPDYETVLKLTQVYTERYFNMENDDEDYAPCGVDHNTKYDQWGVCCVPKYMLDERWLGGDINFGYDGETAEVLWIIPGV